MSEPLLIALVIAAAILAAGGLVMFALKRKPDSSDGEAERLVQQLIQQQSELAGRIATISEAQTQTRQEITQTLNERLENVSQRMGQSLEDSAKKTAETLGNLTNRLTVIDEAQKNITELSGEVVSLQHILSNKQSRGAYGQGQMEAIIRDGLPMGMYEFQATLSNGKRPDCLIRLPDTQAGIIVDSKFPREGFELLQEAKSEADKATAKAKIRADLLKHVKDIAEKYLIPGETQDPALMFVPSESIYAELYDSFPAIIQEAHRARVTVVSPNILMLAINTIQTVLKDARMREQATLIQKEVGELLKDTKRLSDRVENLQRHFGQTDKDMREILISAEKISRRSEKIEQVDFQPDDNAKPISSGNADLLDGK